MTEQKKVTEVKAADLKAEQKRTSDSIAAVAAAGVTDISKEQEQAANTHAKHIGGRLAQERMGDAPDQEQAAGGLVRASEKFAGVDVTKPGAEKKV